MSEQQTCPAHMREPGPWRREEGLDLWVTDRWSADPEVVRRKHDAEDAEGLKRENAARAGRGEAPIALEEYRTRCHVRASGCDLWLWSWGPPRTCNFCGSIHPEDAFRLLAEGWELELARPCKGYLNPPGTRSRAAAFVASVRDPAREPGEGVPSAWSPTPPVKLYTRHFSVEEIERLNAILAKE